MKVFSRLVLLLAGLLAFGFAYAYRMDCKGDACAVTCDNGQAVGTMYWNGTRWSDGLRSSTDRDELAKMMVRAQGSACR
jgi:hypothetical protein